MASTTFSKSRRRALQGLLACIGLLVLYYVAARAPLPYVQSWWQQTESHAADAWRRRKRIAAGMVLTGSLLGAARSNVIQQLGTPYTSDFGEPALIYGLRDARDLLNAGNQWLVLQLNPAGRVANATILDAAAPLPFLQPWWRYGETHWHDVGYRRHRVADGLVHSGALIGKSRAEILATLGSPTSTGKFREWPLVYCLGSERSWVAIDSEWLALELDGADRVITARILRD